MENFEYFEIHYKKYLEIHVHITCNDILRNVTIKKSKTYQ